MDETLTRAFAGKENLVFDGGFGTMLQQRGLTEPGKTADALCITNPQAIADIHRAYVQAGAQVVTTNTFNTNARALAAQGSPYTVTEIYQAAAQCAREAGAAYVAGDIGPLGVFLEPIGDIEPEEAYDYFAENARAAAAAGCDLILIETMMDLNEARIAVTASRENCDLPIIVTMSFMDNGRTMFGTSPDQAAKALGEAGASAVGANCSMGPVELVPVAQAYADAWQGPLIMQPNAGLPELVEGEYVYSVSPAAFADAMEAILALGVTMVGGCCGTTPAHIAELCARLAKMAQK